MPEETSVTTHASNAPLRVGGVRCVVRFLYYRYLGRMGHGDHRARRVVRVARVRRSTSCSALVRGFALIPVTNLVVLAIPIFPPVPLFVLTFIGIVISSASIYAFAGSLKLGEYFERKHARADTERVRAALQRNPTAIVDGMELLADRADRSHLLRLRRHEDLVRPLHVGVLVGEGAICAIYIFAGSSLLDVGKRVFAARRGGGAGRRAGLRRSGVRRALRALPRAGRRAHSAPLGVAADVRGAHRARARCRRDASDRDVDESRRADRRRGVSRDRRSPTRCRRPLRSAPTAPSHSRAAPRPSWNGWSPTPDNARYQPTACGLRAEQIPRLTLAWAFGFAGDVTAFAAPTVFDGHVFVGSAGGRSAGARRRDSGCVEVDVASERPRAHGAARRAARWPPRAAVRRSHGLVLRRRRRDRRARLEDPARDARLDAADGCCGRARRRRLRARVVVGRVARRRSRRIRAARSAAASSRCACATARSSGRPISPTSRASSARTARGAPLYGPSGAAVWSTPTVDAARGLLVCHDRRQLHGARHRDERRRHRAGARRDGRIAWLKQITRRRRLQRLLQPRAPLELPVRARAGLTTSARRRFCCAGGERLLAGQKSGIVYALDATRRGRDPLANARRRRRHERRRAMGHGDRRRTTSTRRSPTSAARAGAGNPFDTRRYVLDPQRGGGLTALRVADGSRAVARRPRRPAPTARPPAVARRNPAPSR